MQAAAAQSSRQISRFLQDRVSPVIVIGYQAVVVVCMFVLPFAGWRWMQQPFLGAFLEHTRVINTVTPSQPGSWELQRYGLPFGYQVVALNAEQVAGLRDIQAVLNRYAVGDQVTVSVLGPEGGQQELPVRLQHIPVADQLTYFLVPYFIAWVYLLSSLYVFSLRRNDPAGRAFALFTAAAAYCMAGLFDLYTTNLFTYLWTFSVALSGGALFNLAFVFPKEFRWVSRYPPLRWIGYVPTAILSLIAFPTLFNDTQPLLYAFAWRFEFVFLALAGVFFIAWAAVRRYTSASPIEREQARLILWGSAVAFVPISGWMFLTSVNPSLRFSPLLLLPLAVFPVATGYAILRYRLLNLDYFLSRGALYTALTILAAIGYALLVSGLSLVLGGSLRPTHPLVVGLMVFLVALALDPLRNRLQQVVNAVFFRGQTIYRRRLESFGQELTQAIDLPVITNLLRQYADQDLLPTQLHVFVQDPLSEHYVAVPTADGQITTDIRFPANSALVTDLRERNDSIFLEEKEQLRESLKSDQVRLVLLDCQLFVPLPGRRDLIGWLALGERRSGEPYSTQALRFLEALSGQAALAVERAQVVADLERRVDEMNVLTRVAQGTNFTVAFDDILELIFAQTSRVIPTLDFRVLLRDESSDVMYYAFFLRNDERVSEWENNPIAQTKDLEEEVLKTQRSIRTDDYLSECRSRGFLPESTGLFAYMGVPLIAGAETIGAIGVGSRDPGAVYTEEQLNLLQAIANQAAGAIVKSRLLQETERRARQLATLNEIGRGLTSTLELKPLLSKILYAATEILNCDAGSLFLVDQQTGELVFEVVIGPVASDLIGTRLPPGKGVVGEAVEMKKAIIANDAKRRKEWFQHTDEITGFSTQDLLVVPMMVKDRVIGVIELINKKDGMPFNQSDQELLTTFTSQATIAIENARLYTMTDQALAARVEELSVMQRIDRELNASLDVGRAMRITLDWAMRQSDADAGLVGVVDESGVQVMTSQGYAQEFNTAGESANGRGNKLDVLPLDQLPAVLEALLSGQAQCVEQQTSASGLFLLTGAQSQMVIPIRRETEVIGIMMLESRKAEACVEDVLAFLSRLSDHAAIAIANAQLYSKVEAANLAKSKFVSFVAHELKNPMASIKGYTELMAQGMAGPINDMQSSFLATVHSNVERMNTIVTDLNDLTKIEVGSLRLDFKTVSIQDVVQDVIRTLRRQIDDKELALDLQVPDNLPLVWADPNRVTQILVNLVSNATKYTLHGGRITLGAEKWVDVEAQTPLEVVHIRVQDTGIGIAAEDQPRIFEQYFRTDISKDAASGTGLGLNISKSLVEMQGGRIWFESQLGKGTTFHFTIPVAESA